MTSHQYLPLPVPDLLMSVHEEALETEREVIDLVLHQGHLSTDNWRGGLSAAFAVSDRPPPKSPTWTTYQPLEKRMKQDPVFARRIEEAKPPPPTEEQKRDNARNWLKAIYKANDSGQATRLVEPSPSDMEAHASIDLKLNQMLIKVIESQYDGHVVEYLEATRASSPGRVKDALFKMQTTMSELLDARDEAKLLLRRVRTLK